MKRIGVTGGIGSGKTTVCRIFESLGIPVYYADLRGRHITVNCPGVVAEIKKLFGDDIYTDEGLDRKRVADLVFSQPSLLSALNSIVHPAVTEDFERWTEEQLLAGASYVIMESAIIFEAGLEDHFDVIITVSAPETVRIERVAGRDLTSVEKVRERISRQISDDQRNTMADRIIVNDGQAALMPQILKLDYEFKNCAQ